MTTMPIPDDVVPDLQRVVVSLDLVPPLVLALQDDTTLAVATVRGHQYLTLTDVQADLMARIATHLALQIGPDVPSGAVGIGVSRTDTVYGTRQSVIAWVRDLTQQQAIAAPGAGSDLALTDAQPQGLQAIATDLDPVLLWPDIPASVRTFTLFAPDELGQLSLHGDNGERTLIVPARLLLEIERVFADAEERLNGPAALVFTRVGRKWQVYATTVARGMVAAARNTVETEREPVYRYMVSGAPHALARLFAYAHRVAHSARQSDRVLAGIAGHFTLALALISLLTVVVFSVTPAYSTLQMISFFRRGDAVGLTIHGLHLTPLFLLALIPSLIEPIGLPLKKEPTFAAIWSAAIGIDLLLVGAANYRDSIGMLHTCADAGMRLSAQMGVALGSHQTLWSCAVTNYGQLIGAMVVIGNLLVVALGSIITALGSEFGLFVFGGLTVAFWPAMKELYGVLVSGLFLQWGGLDTWRNRTAQQWHQRPDGRVHVVDMQQDDDGVWQHPHTGAWYQGDRPIQ